MQPDPDKTNTQHSQPDADSTVPEGDKTQPGAATARVDSSGPDVDPTAATRRVTAQEAADELGITVEAVRARIRRGTLSREKAPDGTVSVLLAAEQTRQGRDRSIERTRTDDADSSGTLRERERANDRSREGDAVVDALREQIAMLRSDIEDRKEEARRKDAIIMALSQRFPELPPTRASSGAAATEAQEEGSGIGEGQEAPRRRSWFVRFFYGP